MISGKTVTSMVLSGDLKMMQSITDLKNFLDNSIMLEWWDNLPEDQLEERRAEALAWIWKEYHDEDIPKGMKAQQYVWETLVPGYLTEVLGQDPYDYGFETPLHKISFEVEGVEALEKTVVAQGTSGRVYLPARWIGHRVKIILLE